MGVSTQPESRAALLGYSKCLCCLVVSGAPECAAGTFNPRIGGSTPPRPGNGQYGTTISVSYPASSPYVVAIGGTTMYTNTDGTWAIRYCCPLKYLYFVGSCATNQESRCGSRPGARHGKCAWSECMEILRTSSKWGSRRDRRLTDGPHVEPGQLATDDGDGLRYDFLVACLPGGLRRPAITRPASEAGGNSPRRSVLHGVIASTAAGLSSNSCDASIFHHRKAPRNRSAAIGKNGAS
jgi:hypothetical protein